MNEQTATQVLVKEIAAAAAGAPGVAFLKPGISRLLRSALPFGSSETAPSVPSTAGVRITRRDDHGIGEVEVMLVAVRTMRTVDVARQVRHAVLERLAAYLPAEETPHVKVTVTGLA